MKKYLIAASLLFTMASCGNHRNDGTSTPIDSTIVNGTAPATYGPASNPATDTMPKTNVNDTGTKANNVHNSGTR